MEKEAFEIIKEICFLLLELKEAYQDISYSNNIPWMPSEQQIRLHFDALLVSYSLKEFRKKLGKLQLIIRLHITANQFRRISNEERRRINESLEKLEQELAFLLVYYIARNSHQGRASIKESSFFNYE